MSKRNTKLINVELNSEARRRIPSVFEVIYKMVKTPIDDRDNPDDDETFCVHTLKTIDVESVVVVDEGQTISINNEIDIPVASLLEDKEEDYSTSKIWRDKEEAKKAWAYLTDLQIKKAEKERDKIEKILGTLNFSKEERAF
jgi:hypothetical protein